MATDYNYDDQGQFFPFFILTITGLVTLPLTYTLLKPTKELENTAPRIKSDFRPKHAELVDGQKRKQWRRERRLKRMITAAVGWAVIAFMCYLIKVTARSTPKLWDPYDILGVSRSADEKAIKSHYKKLSKNYHPDKVRPNPALNQTVESLNDLYVEMTKAYKALTDEEVRNNYMQFGHPDGKQSFSIGIALPTFIITDGNGKYVLLVYGLLLGVLLPYVVGKWWYGTQKVTKEKVLIASAGNMFREYNDEITERGILKALSSGEEFKDVLKGDKAEDRAPGIERKVLEDGPTSEQSAGGLVRSDRNALENIQEGARRKVLSLLWAYVSRTNLDGSTSDDEKYEVAPIALALNESFLAIALAYGQTIPILNSFRVSQYLIQAIIPSASPLLQLPYLNNHLVDEIEGRGAKKHLTVQQLMSFSDEKRRQLLIGSGKLSKQQYESVVAVARQLPALHVEKAFFKVTGEKFITPSSLVQFVVKARFIPPGTANPPEVNELDLEDVDPAEGDLDALLGRKPTKKTKSVDGKVSTREDQPTQPPLAYAPYFARDHAPRWHIFLADSKQGKMAVPPFQFSTFEKPIVGEDGRATFNIQTLKMQFQAPPQTGQFTFVMHMICDSYIGFDTKMEVTMIVEDMARAEAIQGEDEISEPEEDSLAGQMSALKTGGVSGLGATTSGQKRKPRRDDSSDDESDTDGSEDDASATDTDTDSDED
ncbi:MAG: secretory subunit [Vezdaea aestivalis]|nr:MAG: secretory subunit [Vezdaea aestivalis]